MASLLEEAQEKLEISLHDYQIREIQRKLQEVQEFERRIEMCHEEIGKIEKMKRLPLDRNY